MKTLLIVLDGLGDRPCKELQGKTPLEAAFKPNLNFLASKSKCGLMWPVKGIAPESDEAMLALFGYDIYKIHTGRGVLEAIGAGMKFHKAINVRVNFVKMSGDNIKNIEAELRKNQKKKIEKLLNSIKLLCKFSFKATVGHRGVLLLYGKLSARVSNTHPGYKVVRNEVTTALPIAEKIKNGILKIRKCRPLNRTKEAKNTAEIINSFVNQAKKLLKPMNLAVVTRGASNKLPKLKKLPKIICWR